MIFVYIGLGVSSVVGCIVFIVSIKKKKMMKEVEQSVKETLASYGEISTNEHHLHVTLNSKTYQILFYYVASAAELTINSKIMWEVRDSSQVKLINQGHFLSSSKPKIVIVFPTVNPIKRYINENEMEFVTYQNMFYNMYIVKPHDLTSLLEVLKNA